MIYQFLLDNQEHYALNQCSDLSKLSEGMAVAA